MTENEHALHDLLQKSFDTIKQVCVQYFSISSEACAFLESWSLLFEEYSCASRADISSTPLGVHSDIDCLTKSKTKRHLSGMLDELQIYQYVSRQS